ncbi:unnamed protein product, partial [Didymodactylos carnosus]
ALIEPVYFRNRHKKLVVEENLSSSVSGPSSAQNSLTTLVSPSFQSGGENYEFNKEPTSAIKKQSRFLDIQDRPSLMLSPISDYANSPLLPLETSVKPLHHLVPNLNRCVYIAKQNTKNNLDGLTSDEAASIHLYTMEWDESNQSLYSQLNRALRAVERETLIPYFSYLKLFLTALYKLPSIRATVWRGVKTHINSSYRSGMRIVWWGISSCTSSVSMLESETFLGKTGIRTLFSIECFNGKRINPYTYYKTEDEILLLPGSYFEVVSELDAGRDLHIIHMREITPPFPLIEPPFGLPATEINLTSPNGTIRGKSDTSTATNASSSSNLNKAKQPVRRISVSKHSKLSQSFKD